MRSIDAVQFSPYEGAFLPGERLSNYAYSLCGGPCAGLFRLENEQMLLELVQKCIALEIPYRVLGGMSNILVSDTGFDGIILLNRGGSLDHTVLKKGNVILKVSSGVSMNRVVRYCELNEISGFEWAAGLPGTVGGAVYGNAGAFGTEISDIFRSGKLLDPKGNIVYADVDKMEYSYRSSLLKRLKNNSVLISAEFELIPGKTGDIQKKGGEYRERRRAGQPVGEPSLGSVFKNPEGFAAGKLIQDAGLKGKSIGNAVVSQKHGNFITTSKGVRSQDYLALIREVKEAVFEKFGIELEPEIELFGFDE